MLRLRTLGGLSVERSDGAAPPIGVAAGRRRLALLAMLSAAEPRAVPRDKLLAVFWPESDSARARHALDQALYALKRDLGSETLFVGRDELSLNPAEIGSDIGDFRAAIATRDHVAAVTHYTGAFLDGVHVSDAPDFERWADDERASVERDYEDVLETLANDAVARDDHRDAARWWQLLAARNPRRTRVIVALMSQLAKAGDRDAALRHAEMYQTLARDEGDVEPNPAVAALADTLRRTPAAGIGAPAASPATATLPIAAASPIESGTTTRQRRIAPRLVLVAVTVVVALSAAWTFVARPSREAPWWIVPAELENRTGDSTFDRLLDVALRTGLEQSKLVTLLPRTRVQGALARMGRPAGELTNLDDGLALEVAQREGVNAVVSGAVDRVDSSYVITLRLVDAKSGVALASEKSVASRRSDVISALDDIVRRLRKDIGESGASRAKYDRPLPLATTRSLEALRRYADGIAAVEAGRRDAALLLWREAVALDSGFALAHAELGAAAYFGNDRITGDFHFTRALALIDRLTDRERFQVRAASEAWRGNRENAIAIRRALLAEYPDDPAAWGQIGYDYMRLGRSREAIDALRRQIARDSTTAADHINLASALKGAGELEAALQSYARAFALRPSDRTVNNLNHEYGVSLVLAGRVADARAAFDLMRAGTPDQRAHGERSLGLLSMHLGKHSEAIDHLRRAVLLSQRPNRELTEARNRLFLAAAEREKGWLDSARAEVLAARRLFDRAYFEPMFLMYLGKALVRNGQATAAVAVFDSLRRRARPDNPGDVTSLRVLAGELALAQGRPDSALRVLRLAITFDSSAYVIESLAFALAATGDASGAIPIYERLRRSPRGTFGGEGEVLALTAPRDVGALYERLRDTTLARTAYEEQLTRWREADSDLVALRASRDALNRLRSGLKLDPAKR